MMLILVGVLKNNLKNYINNLKKIILLFKKDKKYKIILIRYIYNFQMII